MACHSASTSWERQEYSQLPSSQCRMEPDTSTLCALKLSMVAALDVLERWGPVEELLGPQRHAQVRLSRPRSVSFLIRLMIAVLILSILEN